MLKWTSLVPFVLAITLGALGCIDLQEAQKTYIVVDVDLSALPASALDRIDGLELRTGGAIADTTYPMVPLQRDANGAVVAVQTLDDRIEVESGKTLFIRVAARAGTMELSSDNETFLVPHSDGPRVVTLKLEIAPSVNGCEIAEIQTPALGERPMGSFDVLAIGRSSLIAYTEQSSTGLKLYSTIRSADGTLSAPALLDTEVTDPSSQSFLPAIAADSDGFVVAWGRKKSDGQLQTVVARLDSAGKPTAIRRTIDAGTPKELRPSLAISQDRIALAWDKGMGADQGDRVMVSLLDRATLEPIGAAALLGTLPVFASSHASLTARNEGGFAALWTVHDMTDASLRQHVALLSPSLAQSGERALTEPGDKSTLGRIITTQAGLLAAWEQIFQDTGEETIVTSALSPDANSSETRVNLDDLDHSANWPNLAMGAEGGVTVAYQFRESNPGPQILLTRIDSRGNKVGASDLQISQNFASESGARYPDVVSLGTSVDGGKSFDEYAVFWADQPSNHESPVRLMTARVRCEHGNDGGAK